MLALEAENYSKEAFERISNFAQRDMGQIIEGTGTSTAMAANAVKILPGIAEQLGDIERMNSRVYPIGQLFITENEITTEEHNLQVDQELISEKQIQQVLQETQFLM
jgi:hypothetical protein